MKSVIEFFTPQQIADRLQLNVLTIYSYIKSKKIPAIRLGRAYRVRNEDLQKFLMKHRITK